jgi:hypothetical protein
MQQWTARNPPSLTPSFPAELRSAAPLLRDAASELRLLTAAFGVFLAGPQALGADAALWRPAAESLDAFVRQLVQMSTTPEAKAEGGRAVLSTRSLELLQTAQSRLAQVLGRGGSDAPLRSGQAKTLGQALNSILQALGAQGAGLSAEALGETFTQPLRQLLEQIEGFRWQNLAAQDTGRPLQLILPMVGPGLINLAQINLLRGEREAANQGRETTGFNLILMVELSRLGLLKFEVHVQGKSLSATITTAHRDVKEQLDAMLDDFCRQLEEAGCLPQTLTCIFDRELRPLAPSGKEGITYKKLNVKA